MGKTPRSETGEAGCSLKTICERDGSCQFRNKEMRDGQLVTFNDPRTVEECGSWAVTQFILGDEPTRQRLVASECPVEAEYPDIREAVEAEGTQINA